MRSGATLALNYPLGMSCMLKGIEYSCYHFTQRKCLDIFFCIIVIVVVVVVVIVINNNIIH